jgi:hypothetical protein
LRIAVGRLAEGKARDDKRAARALQQFLPAPARRIDARQEAARRDSG